MILKKGTKKARTRAPGTESEQRLTLIANHLRDIIEVVDEDPNREGLRDTPRRYGKSLEFLTSGYQANVLGVVGKALFQAESSELVIVKDIELYSLCEHHLLPFYGKAHIGYIPNKKIIGLSKIPRIVDVFARRFQVQERLTAQIADALVEVLQPLGVAVVIEASHFCMMMRGVEKQNSQTITSAMRGEFYSDPTTRGEFLNLLKAK